MKVKEAVDKLKGQVVSMKEVEALYHYEVMSRAGMRAYGKNIISVSLMKGVLDEMDVWIEKVCRGIGWSDEESKRAMEECRKTADLSCSLAVTYRGKA